MGGVADVGGFETGVSAGFGDVRGGTGCVYWFAGSENELLYVYGLATSPVCVHAVPAAMALAACVLFI